MNNGRFIDVDVVSLYEAVKHQIKRDVDQAKMHLKYHVNNKGQILELQQDCEYCQIYFEEQRILK
jgi:hypothetical protein